MLSRRQFPPEGSLSLCPGITGGQVYWSKFILLCDCPSVFTWTAGLGTDRMTEEEEIRGQRVTQSWEPSCPLGAQVQESHPPVRTLLPTWARASGGCSQPAWPRTLSSQDQARSARCWTQTHILPSSHMQPPGRAFWHGQLDLSDVTIQGSRMRPLCVVWGWDINFSRSLMTSIPLNGMLMCQEFQDSLMSEFDLTCSRIHYQNITTLNQVSGLKFPAYPWVIPGHDSVWVTFPGWCAVAVVFVGSPGSVPALIARLCSHFCLCCENMMFSRKTCLFLDYFHGSR